MERLSKGVVMRAKSLEHPNGKKSFKRKVRGHTGRSAFRTRTLGGDARSKKVVSTKR